MKKPPILAMEDRNEGIVCLHVILAAFMAVCVLQAVFKYHPNPGGLISPIPYFGILVGLIIPVGAVLFVVFMEIIFVGYRNSSWHQLFVERRDQSVGYDLFFYLLHIFRIRHLVFIYFTLGLYLYAEQFKGEFIGAAVGWGGPIFDRVPGRRYRFVRIRVVVFRLLEPSGPAHAAVVAPSQAASFGDDVDPFHVA